MLIDGYHGLKMAMGENPFRVYGTQGKSPATRMAVAGLIRKTLIETQNYMAKRKEAKETEKGAKKGKGKGKKGKDEKKHFDRNLGFEHIAMLLEKKMPARFHMHRRDDIETALRIADEFGFNAILDHCTEGWLIPEVIAKHKVPAVIGPMDTGKVKYELKHRDIKAPLVLHKAGVMVALTTDHPVMPIRSLRMNGALAVRGGLKDEEAMRMLTINPAKLLRVDKDMGSIAKGKLANLAIYSGEPLDMRTEVEHVWIEGEELK
jgi:imidazolonepropionase-like amidohydrolase